MAQPSIFDQILDYSHRANPYPLYAELRRTPVTRQVDGSYLISTYPEIVSVLHDPRISSDMRNSAGAAAADTAEAPGLPPNFLHLDSPRARPAAADDHAVLRAAQHPRTDRRHGA